MKYLLLLFLFMPNLSQAEIYVSAFDSLLTVNGNWAGTDSTGCKCRYTNDQGAFIRMRFKSRHIKVIGERMPSHGNGIIVLNKDTIPFSETGETLQEFTLFETELDTGWHRIAVVNTTDKFIVLRRFEVGRPELPNVPDTTEWKRELITGWQRLFGKKPNYKILPYGADSVSEYEVQGDSLIWRQNHPISWEFLYSQSVTSRHYYILELLAWAVWVVSMCTLIIAIIHLIKSK